MASQCGLEPPGEDYCSCGCDAFGTWCGKLECWTKHFGFPENHQEKLAATYRAESIRAARKSIAMPNWSSKRELNWSNDD